MFKKTLIVGSFLALLSGCQSMLQTETQPISLLGNWKISAIMGQKTPNYSPAELIFAKDGKLSGNNSCNNFFGSYTQTGNHLKINLGGNTMKACVDELMAQEQLVSEVMPKINSIKSDNNELLLQSASGQTLLTLSPAAE